MADRVDLAAWVATQQRTEMLFPGSEHSFVSGSGAQRPIQVVYRRTSVTDYGASPVAPHLDSVIARGSIASGFELVVSEVVFTSLCQGPPGHAHGGSVAAVLDELMGGAGWLNGFPVLARRIEVDFVKPVPIGHPHFGVSALVLKEGRKLSLSAALLSHRGQVLAHSRGLFIELAEEQMKSLISKRTEGA